MARKNPDLDQQKKIKNDLDDILNDMKVEGRIDDVKAFDVIKENVYKVAALDYNLIKKRAKNKAEKHVNAIVDFYLPNLDYTDPNNQFIFQKMNSDKFRLTKDIIQLEIMEHSLAKLNEEIDNGNYNPRLWEVMATLMKSFDSLNINYAKMEILIENNYKTVNEELEYKKSIAINILSDNNQTKKGNYKDLLQQIKLDQRLEINNQKIECDENNYEYDESEEL